MEAAQQVVSSVPDLPIDYVKPAGPPLGPPLFHPASQSVPDAPAEPEQPSARDPPAAAASGSLRSSNSEKRQPHRPTYTCKEPGCSKSFNRPVRLERHMRTHTGERPFVCDECGKSFPQAYALKRHGLTHTGERPHKCPEPNCNYAFQLAQHLHRHMALHKEPKPYVCTHEGCTERFAKHSQLLRHQCIHTGELPYKCEGCGKAFPFPSKLQKHVDKKHNKKTSFVCGAKGCLAAFVSQRELTEHLKSVHPGSFECAVCGKEFKVASSLEDHEATHMLDRTSVVCEFPGCSATYSSTKNLRTHFKAIHEGLRPWKCSEPGCGKDFAYKQQWQLHEQRHKKKREQPADTPSKAKKLRKSKDEIESLVGSGAIAAPNHVVPVPGYSY